MKLKEKQIILVANTSWYIYNFKVELVEKLLDIGTKVITITGKDPYVSRLKELGCECHEMNFYSRGRNPFQDLSLFFHLYFRYKSVRPACVLQFTTKPNIYGSFAARLLGIPTVSNVSGLGAAFDRRYGVRFIVTQLYRWAFRYPYHIFFLNSEDRDLFIEEEIVDAHRTSLIPGAGVDIQRYRPMPKSESNGNIVFLLLARLIWEKGIREYMHIADTLKKKYDHLTFQLLGFPADNSRDGLTADFIDTRLKESTVEYLGATDDVVPYIRDADCVVLPTRYREGIPRSLLEAASMAKPIIASNNVGCREIVDHGVNGYLFNSTVEGFIEAIERFIHCSSKVKTEMGKKGREKVLREFDIKKVIGSYIEVIESLLQ